MAIRLFASPMSSASRITWALEELGIPYEYVQVDLKKNEQKTPEFLAINPNGKVPALVDDDFSYFESLAIIVHLGERYGVERGMWPASGQDRADALSWSTWAMTELQGYLRDFMYHGLDTRISYKPEERSQAAAEFDRFVTEKNFAMIEKRLADREYICGSFTLVDVVVGSVLRFGAMMNVPMGDLPNVKAYVQRLGSRPAVARIR
jgi:glutathione S-transferase